MTEELKSNTSPKPFWNYVKSKRKGSSDLVSLKVNDEFLNDDISIANNMNHSMIVFRLLLRTKLTFQILIMSLIRNYAIFIALLQVAKMLNNLNMYKSPGPDAIPPRILKEFSQVLSSLALLLNTFFIGSVTDNVGKRQYHSGVVERE